MSLPSILITSPDCRAWCKRPSFHKLQSLVNELGFKIKSCRYDHLVEILDNEGNQISVGKGSRLRNVFDIEEAYKIIHNRSGRPTAGVTSPRC